MKLVPHSQQDMVARHLVLGGRHNIPSHKMMNQTWVVSAGLCMAIFKLAANTPGMDSTSWIQDMHILMSQPTWFYSEPEVGSFPASQCLGMMHSSCSMGRSLSSVPSP